MTHQQGLTGAAIKPVCVRSLSLSTNQNALETPPARADSTFKVTMVPGDGVGPELMMAVKEVFKVNIKRFCSAELFLPTVPVSKTSV